MAIVGYEYRIDGGSPVDMGLPDPLTFTVGDLEEATIYDFEVRGYDAEGNRTPWSNVATASTFGPTGIQLICSFECSDGTNVGAHWSGNQDSRVDVQDVTVHSQDNALRMHQVDANGVERGILALPAFTVTVVRVFIRFATLPVANAYLVAARNDSSMLGLFFKQSDQKLYAATKTGSPNIGATGVLVTAGSHWYQIDMRIDQTSGDRQVEIEVDEVAVGTVADSEVTSAGTLYIHMNEVNMDVYYDSIVVSNVGADYPIGAGEYLEE